MAKKNLTQNEWVLNYLQKHKNGITQRQAENMYGIMRLGARIWELKNEWGYPIVMETVVVKNRRNQDCRVARYKLVK